MKAEFQSTTALLEVHWDGKLLPDLTGKELVDRLPALLSGVGLHQLLGVSKLTSSTGEAQASAVEDLLNEWRISDRVVAMCFDTTASNTGKHKGACVLLENKLGKKLLHLACRHHIYEIVLASIFKECMGKSSGPDIAILKRFKDQWTKFDKSCYKTSDKDTTVNNALDDHSQSIEAFALAQLQMSQPRDDYKELLELVIIFVGGVPPHGVRFKAPGAIHHASWMAKALYSLKIWMSKEQFQLSESEENGIREACIFITVVYIKAWFRASLPASAPNNDLLF